MWFARCLYLLLLCQNCGILNWYFLQETTRYCNVRPQCVLYYTEKKISYVFLNVTAEKNAGKMYFVSEIINDYNYTEPMW